MHMLRRAVHRKATLHWCVHNFRLANNDTRVPNNTRVKGALGEHQIYSMHRTGTVSADPFHAKLLCHCCGLFTRVHLLCTSAATPFICFARKARFQSSDGGSIGSMSRTNTTNCVKV